jgi:hypothetical protein
LNLAHSWVTEKGVISIDLMHCLLIESICRLSVEHSHYPGTSEFNQNPSNHVLVDLTDATPSEQLNALIPTSVSTRDSRLMNSELISLLDGVNQFGEGKWKSILANPQRYPFTFRRTSKILSEKWARLKISKITIFCRSRSRSTSVVLYG